MAVPLIVASISTTLTRRPIAQQHSNKRRCNWAERGLRCCTMLTEQSLRRKVPEAQQITFVGVGFRSRAVLKPFLRGDWLRMRWTSAVGDGSGPSEPAERSRISGPARTYRRVIPVEISNLQM